MVICLKSNAISDLIARKGSPKRKPMVLKCARQVGKTWMMKEFGQNDYEHYAFFNFDEEDLQQHCRKYMNRKHLDTMEQEALVG